MRTSHGGGGLARRAITGRGGRRLAGLTAAALVAVSAAACGSSGSGAQPAPPR